MSKQIVLFEDSAVTNLVPLILSRPVFELRCGVFSLRKKVENLLKAKINGAIIRNDLAAVYSEKSSGIQINSVQSGETLFLNGRIVLDNNVLRQAQQLEAGSALTSGDTLAAVCVSEKQIDGIIFDTHGFPNFDQVIQNRVELEKLRLVQFPWDLVTFNSDELINDYNHLASDASSFDPKPFEQSFISGTENIIAGSGIEIFPGAVLDASGGPIILGDNVKIMHNAVVQGPAFIGENSIIKMGATIYHNTSIGKVCKVGGEVEDSIIHAYSNKQHDGFLGHSYLGEWVNLGAGTNNSDLKNNYGSIRVKINGNEIDSGMQFVGLTMGDHSKCAIGTQFNTGTVVGIACNIFGNGFPPKYIPSFSWGGSEGLSEHSFDKAVETSRKVMARRNVQLTDNHTELMRKIFENSAVERNG